MLKSPHRLTTASQHDPVLQLVIFLGCANWTTARFFKVVTGPESSRDEFGSSDDDRCVDTGVFQQRYLPARIGVCLQSTPPAAATDQLHHPDSSRLVRRPGSSSMRAGSPSGSPHSGSGSAGVPARSVAPKLRSNKAVFIKVTSFSWPLELVGKCLGKGGAGQQTLSVASQEGSSEYHAATCPAFRKRTTTRLLQTRCHFSSVFWCRNSSSPIARISPSCVSEQGRLALPEKHCTARTHHCADPGGSNLLEVTQERAEHLGGAFLGAPVPAGSNLKRPNGEIGSACVLVRRAFASLGPCQPFVSRQQVVHVLTQIRGLDVREREKKLDSRCIVSPGCRLCPYGRKRTGNRLFVGIESRQRRTHRRRHAVPRFLLQKIIFIHSPYDDLYPNKPRLRGNLFMQDGWHRLRGTAGTECATPPMREIAAYPRCSASLLAPEPVGGLSWWQAWKNKQRRQPLLWANRQYL